jgi:hypothetical protein
MEVFQQMGVERRRAHAVHVATPQAGGKPVG